MRNFLRLTFVVAALTVVLPSPSTTRSLLASDPCFCDNYRWDTNQHFEGYSYPDFTNVGGWHQNCREIYQAVDFTQCQSLCQVWAWRGGQNLCTSLGLNGTGQVRLSWHVAFQSIGQNVGPQPYDCAELQTYDTSWLTYNPECH
jgi:hypothetical protein